METVFWGKDHGSLAMEGWPLQWFIFNTNIRWLKCFWRWQALFFRQKCDKESIGQAGERTLLHISVVFFSSYKLPKTVTVTTLLFSGPVTLLCGTFLFMWLSEGPVQLLDCRIDMPSTAQLAYPITPVHQWWDSGSWVLDIFKFSFDRWVNQGAGYCSSPIWM